MWARPLANGDKAVVFYNDGRSGGAVDISVEWAELSWAATASVSVRDLWKQMSGGVVNDPTELPARRNELQRFAVSSVRARIHLGWSWWTDLADGLARVRSAG